MINGELDKLGKQKQDLEQQIKGARGVVKSEDLQCTICWRLRPQPSECTNCGQLICQSCLAAVNSCPSCRGTINDIKQSNFGKRMIQQITTHWKKQDEKAHRLKKEIE